MHNQLRSENSKYYGPAHGYAPALLKPRWHPHYSIIASQGGCTCRLLLGSAGDKPGFQLPGLKALLPSMLCPRGEAMLPLQRSSSPWPGKKTCVLSNHQLTELYLLPCKATAYLNAVHHVPAGGRVHQPVLTGAPECVPCWPCLHSWFLHARLEILHGPLCPSKSSLASTPRIHNGRLCGGRSPITEQRAWPPAAAAVDCGWRRLCTGA